MMYRRTCSSEGIENLESRQLLAVDPWSVRVNFQPESTTPPPGYKYDYGAAFGRRGNGLTYGWNREKQSDAVQTESVFNNVRGETFIRLNEGDTWSIAVPGDGWYQVRALMGDPNRTDGDYRLRAEGKMLVKGKPYGQEFPFVEGIDTIHVTDGRLTLSADSKAVLNRLSSVEITRVDPPEAYPQGAPIEWKRANVHSPIARVEAGQVRVGDRLFVMGGFTRHDYEQATRRIDILDLRTHQWTRGPDLPGPTTHMAVASDGQRFIYTAGGQVNPGLSKPGSDEVWRYDILADRWDLIARLPDIRFLPQMSYIDGRLHVIGGNDATRVVSTNTHWVLDLADPRAGWTAAAPLPEATDHHSQIVIDGAIYVLGGEIDHGTSYLVSRSLYRYDPATDAWTRLQDQPVAASHAEATTFTDGRRIFVIAGQGGAQQIIADVRSYNIATGQWEVHPSLPTGRKGGIGWIDGNRLYYLAGDDAKYGQPAWGYVGTIG